MKTLNLFSTPIGMVNIPRAVASRLNREILKDISVIQKLDREGREWSKTNYVGGYTSYSSITDIHERFAPFMELKEQIDKEVKKFIKTLNVDLHGRHAKMTTCWINVMPPHVHHSLHLHPLCFISGTYYVQVPAGSGPLKLEDPRMGLFMAAPPRRPTSPYFHEVHPKPGQIVLWESWLRHEVSANRGHGTRISVSFNYEWI